MSSHEDRSGKPNRRQFFKKATAIGLGATLGGSSLWLPHQASAQITIPKEPMPRRPFGRSGIMVSTLSLGGMFDILNNRLMIAKALDWGINYWDTAEGYGRGRSEEGIGRWFARNPHTRKQVFLVTKLSTRRGGDFTGRLEKSLKRLHTDYVDLFFVHGIRGISEMESSLKSWAQTMKKAGKIRLFGFSTHSNMEECLEGAAKLPWIDGIMFTYNYRLMHEPRMKEAVEACYRAGIGLTAMKTQGGGPVKSDSESEIEMAGRFMQKDFRTIRQSSWLFGKISVSPASVRKCPTSPLWPQMQRRQWNKPACQSQIVPCWPNMPKKLAATTAPDASVSVQKCLPRGCRSAMSCAASCTSIPTRISGWHAPPSKLCRRRQKSF
jgi:aryl-alcohol dehydrogenase-like predicted oxidoreductase